MMGENTHKLYTLKMEKLDIFAKAYPDGDDFVILKGSTASAKWRSTSGQHPLSKDLHTRLHKSGITQKTVTGAVFTQDFRCSSKSQAAGIVFGRQITAADGS